MSGIRHLAALMTYCAKHGVRGGFVCYDECQDELLINEGHFSEVRDNPNWKILNELMHFA